MSLELELKLSSEDEDEEPSCIKVSDDTLGYLQKFWSSKTLENVPLPTQTYDIDRDLASKWVSQATGEKEKIMRERFLKEIKYISFNEFLERLTETANKFIEKISTRKYVILTSVGHSHYQPYKSAEWILSLCKVYVKDFPSPSEVIPGTTDLDKYIRSLPSSCRLDILFLDDISYSGEQITKVFNMVRKVASGNPSLRIYLHLLVPIVSEKSFSLMTDHFDKEKVQNLKVYKYISLIQPAFSDDLSIYYKIHPRYGSSGNSSMYTAHKLADSVSVPAHIIAPLISNCEEYYNEKTDFDLSEPPCPWPPYKPLNRRPPPHIKGTPYKLMW